MARASAVRRAGPLRWGNLAQCGLCLLLLCTAARGANTAGASSSRADRESAVRSIPFDKIEPSLRKRVRLVVGKPSIYRRLPIQVTDCDPVMYHFLVTHPEVVVNVWQAMGISRVSLVRQPDGSYLASDGVGSRGVVRYCFSNHDSHVIYAEGAYEGPLFDKPVRAQCVLVFKHGHVRETNGRDYVTCRCDTFIQIEHAGIELLAKTFSPLVTKSADYNFTETAGFLGNLSRTAEANPQGVARMAQRLAQVDPAVRERFVELSGQVAQKRQAGAARMAAVAKAAIPKAAVPKQAARANREPGTASSTAAQTAGARTSPPATTSAQSADGGAASEPGDESPVEQVLVGESTTDDDADRDAAPAWDDDGFGEEAVADDGSADDLPAGAEGDAAEAPADAAPEGSAGGDESSR